LPAGSQARWILEHAGPGWPRLPRFDLGQGRSAHVRRAEERAWVLICPATRVAEHIRGRGWSLGLEATWLVVRRDRVPTPKVSPWI